MLTRPMQRLWRDQRGFVATTDLILIFTIVMLGTIVGLATLRNSVVQEFGDLGSAVGRLNQSYWYEGHEYESDDSLTEARVAGSRYTDRRDFGDVDDPDGQPPSGISVTEEPRAEGEEL